MMERLPRDVMIDIISRLPIKSVLRCKCVSKSWEALLSDPSFAATHFNRASQFSNYIFSDESDKKLLYFVETEEEEDNETPPTSKHLNFPFLTDCLMGSCLGYLCFSTNPVCLFNPITGATILLPQFQETHRLSTCLYGFGLDVSTQECKVVRVHVYWKTFSVQVHTVGRDYSWRTNTVPSMLTDVTGAELQTSLPLELNGSIHWIVLSSVDKEDEFRTCILSFQLDTEVLGVITIPEPLQVIEPYFRNSMMYALQVCGGCLSIIYSPKASFVDMWVMVDYNISQSWVKKYSIQLNCMRGLELEFVPFGFRKNGELMLCLEKKVLVSYNTDSDGYKILRSWWSWIIPFPFVGSLISLKSAYGDSEVSMCASM